MEDPSYSPSVTVRLTIMKTMPNTARMTTSMVIQPLHLVKSMLVQKAKAVTMTTVTMVMPNAIRTDSTGEGEEWRNEKNEREYVVEDGEVGEGVEEGEDAKVLNT